MAAPTAQEQLILELINRARLDPAAEAARLGISLNQGLTASTISAAQKQALAFNPQLNDAADSHSQWMLNTNTFSHTGAGGSSPGTRMTNAGYQFTGAWTWGENIAWSGTTGTLNIDTAAAQHHDNLFLSAGHRVNILNGNFREIGIGSIAGKFSGYNALMTTEDFALSGTSKFITGVVYIDTIDNNFYSIGEGQGGVAVNVLSSGTPVAQTSTWSSGGYTAALTAQGSYDVAFSGTGIADNAGVRVTLGNENIKVDLIDSNTAAASHSATLLAGTANLNLLGINAINGTGNNLINVINGNKAANALSGMGGSDKLFGFGGNDTLIGGAGNDRLYGSSGSDRLTGGIGNDTLGGGGGNDTFVFGALLAGDFGADVISDFAGGAGAGDVIEIDDSWGFLSASAVLAGFVVSGLNQVLTIDANTSITLVGAASQVLNADDFLIV